MTAVSTHGVVVGGQRIEFTLAADGPGDMICRAPGVLPFRAVTLDHARDVLRSVFSAAALADETPRRPGPAADPETAVVRGRVRARAGRREVAQLERSLDNAYRLIHILLTRQGGEAVITPQEIEAAATPWVTVISTDDGLVATNRRVDGYHRQNTGHSLRLFEKPRLKPGQLRRAWKKARRSMCEHELAQFVPHVLPQFTDEEVSS